MGKDPAKSFVKALPDRGNQLSGLLWRRTGGGDGPAYGGRSQQMHSRIGARETLTPGVPALWDAVHPDVIYATWSTVCEPCPSLGHRDLPPPAACRLRLRRCRGAGA